MKAPAPLRLRPFRRSRTDDGSAFIVALGTIAILSLMAANVVRVTTQRQRACFQETSWGESLAAAEAGADIAIATLRSGTWTGWTGPDGNGVRTFQTPVLTHDGEGNTSFYAIVTADSPAALNTTDGRFYRIRSSGVALLSGGKGAVSQDKLNNSLWKLSLRKNRDTGATVTGAGLVSRTIEVIAKPSSLFPRAITLTNAITNNSNAIILDSFDSGDSAKSTNGLYDLAKRQSNAKIGTLDSTGSDLGGMQVYGDLMYSGPAVAGTQGVTGQITTPFAQTLPPVPKPTWTTVNGSYGSVTTPLTLVSGPPGSPKRYKMSGVVLNGAAITMAPPGVGQAGEIEIWITGDITMSGTGQIVSQPGVKVTMYLEGNTAASGKSFANQSNVAANFTIYGVTPADGSARDWKVTGQADFTAAIYGPSFNIKLGGNGAFTGAFIGKTLDIGGSNAAIHYDEALARSGGGSLYEVASWAEDVR